MPGFVLTVANQVLCSHGGQAKPKPIPPPLDRVKIMGMSVVTLTTIYVVGGCGLAAAGSPPCATGSFTMGAMRVKSLGSPIVILPPMPDSKCIPTGNPLLPTPAGQMRVQAS